MTFLTHRDPDRPDPRLEELKILGRVVGSQGGRGHQETGQSSQADQRERV
jgi:hypothetical protein